MKAIQMTELRLNRFAERILVVGSGCALVGTVAALNDSVRGRLVSVLTGDALTELTMAGARLQRVVRTITEAVGYHGTEHASLALFALAALVLLVLMLRT